MLQNLKINPLVLIMTFYQVILVFAAVLNRSSEYKASFSDEALVVFLLPFAFVYSLKRSSLKVWYWFFIYVGISLLSIIVYDLGGVPQPLAGFYDVVLDMKLPICFMGVSYFLAKEKDISGGLQKICWVFVFIGILNIPFLMRDLIVNSGLGMYGQSLTFRGGIYQPQGLYHHQTESVWHSYVATMAAGFLSRVNKNLISRFIFILLGFFTLMHLSTKENICIIIFLSLFFYGKNINLSRLIVTLPLFTILFGGLYFFTPIGMLIQSQFEAYLGIDSYQGQARSVLTLQSFEIAKDFFPLGSGAGTYASTPSYVLGYSEVYYRYGLNLIWGANLENSTFLTDVFWPKVLAQSGFFGMAAFLLFFWKVFGVSITGIVQNSNRVLWLCGTISISVFIFSIAAPPYSQEFMMVVVAYFAAYAREYNRRNNINS